MRNLLDVPNPTAAGDTNNFICWYVWLAAATMVQRFSYSESLGVLHGIKSYSGNHVEKGTCQKPISQCICFKFSSYT